MNLGQLARAVLDGQRNKKALNSKPYTLDSLNHKTQSSFAATTPRGEISVVSVAPGETRILSEVLLLGVLGVFGFGVEVQGWGLGGLGFKGVRV